MPLAPPQAMAEAWLSGPASVRTLLWAALCRSLPEQPPDKV